jgi:hypothetical protein
VDIAVDYERVDCEWGAQGWAWFGFGLGFWVCLPSLEGVGQPAYACIDEGVHAQQLRIAEGEGVVHRNVALDACRRVREHADPAIIDPSTIQHNPTRHMV